MASKLLLYYFPVRARAESIRMILQFGKIPYEDVTVPFADWLPMKKAGEVAPFGQLPTIRLHDGSILAQSGAINRYAARLAQLLPEDPVRCAKADMIFEFAQELAQVSRLLNTWSPDSNEWQENHAMWFKKLPRHLLTADKLLGDGPFYGGTAPHYGDFALFHILDLLVTLEPKALDAHPRLVKYMAAVAELPAIDKYLQTRLQPHQLGMPGSLFQVRSAKK